MSGCVGQIVSDKPLYETVAEAVIAAAPRDPCFHRMNLSELPELEIEIPVLTAPQPLERIEDLEIGVTACISNMVSTADCYCRKLRQRTTWNRTEFLQQTCKKAKLPEETWQDPETEIYLFSSQVFGEELQLSKMKLHTESCPTHLYHFG